MTVPSRDTPGGTWVQSSDIVGKDPGGPNLLSLCVYLFGPRVRNILKSINREDHSTSKQDHEVYYSILGCEG